MRHYKTEKSQKSPINKGVIKKHLILSSGKLSKYVYSYQTVINILIFNREAHAY